MAEKTDPTYEIETDTVPKAKGSKRGLKITGIVAGAVLAIGAAFGGGVLVGVKLAPHIGPGGPFPAGVFQDDKFPGGHLGGPDDGNFRGPDGDHGFQAPNGQNPNGGTQPTPQPSTTP